MNDNIDLNTLLFDNCELVLKSVILNEDKHIETKLYMHYAVLKLT